MFPHTITIFNVINDKYNKRVINNVFFNKQKILSQEGNGDKYTSVYQVIFSNVALKDFIEYEEYISLEDKSNNYTISENDIIVYGECDSIEGLIDLQNSYKEYFLIRSISDNRYGDIDLQNIEVTN